MRHKKLTRMFIDNYKNAFDIYQFINNTIEEYWNTVNKNFLMMHTLDPSSHICVNDKGDTIAKYNLFNIRVNQNNLLYRLRINKVREVEERQLYGTSILSNAFTNDTANYADAITIKYSTEYCYNSHFLLNTYASDFHYKASPKLFGVNDKLVGYQFYNAIINMIPYIYKKLRTEIYKLFEINDDEYSVTFYKNYHHNEYNITDGIIHYNIISMTNKIVINNLDIARFMPFIAYTNKKLHYYYNMDIKSNCEYNYDVITAVVIPTENKVLLSNKYQPVYINDANDYGYNHTPSANNNKAVESYSKSFEDGYIPSFMLLGNLVNHLVIDIVKNGGDDNIIITYNNIGQKPKIIHNTNSIRMISKYNNDNLEKIISPALMKRYNDNKATIDNLLSTATNKLYERIHPFEVNLHNYFRSQLKEMHYNSHMLDKDPIVNTAGNIPYIYMKVHQLVHNYKGGASNIFTWKNNMFCYKYKTLFSLRFYVLGYLPADIYFDDKYDINMLLHYDKKIINRYNNVVNKSFKHDVVLPTEEDLLDHPIMRYLRKPVCLSALLSDTSTDGGEYCMNATCKNDPSGYIRRLDDLQETVDTNINCMTRAYILMIQYGNDIIERFLTNNIEILSKAMFLEEVKDAVSYQRANIKLRQNEFKKEKLQYYNNIQTINTNTNIQDIAIEAQYYNHDIDIITKKLNV